MEDHRGPHMTLSHRYFAAGIRPNGISNEIDPDFDFVGLVISSHSKTSQKKWSMTSGDGEKRLLEIRPVIRLLEPQ